MSSTRREPRLGGLHEARACRRRRDEVTGTYVEISPPDRIVSTESWGADWPDTTNTLALTEEDSRTTITTTMLYPSKDVRDAALQSGMKDGCRSPSTASPAYLASLA
jgi:uncharacterized protein YndB with AHSA1/START domain